LAGLTNGEQDKSIDQFSGVDFLMDENILTNESREEDDSGVHQTPGGTKGINQINSAGFSNQQAMKKVKTSKMINSSNKVAGNMIKGPLVSSSQQRS